MVSTLNIIGAFILGGLIPFGMIGAITGYYWARSDVRKAVFEWFYEHWPEEYSTVYEDAIERELFRGIGDTDGRS